MTIFHMLLIHFTCSPSLSFQTVACVWGGKCNDTKHVIIFFKCCHSHTHLLLCHRMDGEVVPCASLTSFVNQAEHRELKDPSTSFSGKCINEVKNKIELFSGTSSPILFWPDSRLPFILQDLITQCWNDCLV